MIKPIITILSVATAMIVAVVVFNRPKKSVVDTIVDEMLKDFEESIKQQPNPTHASWLEDNLTGTASFKPSKQHNQLEPVDNHVFHAAVDALSLN